MTQTEQWYRNDKDDVHEAVFRFVRKVEEEQSDVYDRLSQLESLYDPYSPTGDDSTEPSQKLANVSENLVASNVDTIHAAITSADIRPRYLTDGADWAAQRRAKKLEYYSEGIGKLTGADRKCKLAFKEGPKKGAGICKVYGDRWGDPVVEVIALEDIIVPDCDSRVGAPPLQLHHVQRNYDRDRLRAEYPDHAEIIDETYGGRSTSTSGGYRAAERNKITVIESIRLPIGKKPPDEDPKKKTAKRAAMKLKAKYVPGRRTVTIENATIEDEPYHDPFHPIAMVGWSERNGSFYPISGAERIMGIQRALNKRNWQIERILDQNALLTTYLRPGDGNVSVKTTKIGNTVVIKGDYPQTPAPPIVHPETYRSRIDLKESVPEQMGVSQFATQSRIPAGLETGAAVREYSQKATERYGPQETAFENFILDVHWLLLHVCKKLGVDAPTVTSSRWHEPIDWESVDMGEVRVQISAASTLPRTAAGREQTVMEWAQAGIISTDSVKRLINHPDLPRELSMYTAALESIEMRIERILDGGIAGPEPLDNLEMFRWRGTAAYHNASMITNCPEEVLEGLWDAVTQAAFMIDMQAQNDNAGAGMQGGAAPPGAPPQAALAPQAMQLQAG